MYIDSLHNKIKDELDLPNQYGKNSDA
ncbi:MAG TPA: barstar family protein [Candidatus Eubacterium faecavium]|nr:barstar family protein [Candidatus Eubacterium faecavium]